MAINMKGCTRSNRQIMGLFALLAMATSCQISLAHDDFSSLIREIKPTIVIVRATGHSKRFIESQKPELDRVLGDYQEFYEAQGDKEPARKASTKTKQGSGLAVTPDGYILTVAHLVRDASRIEIATGDGTSFDAELVRIDQNMDLALLKANEFKADSLVNFAEEPFAEGQAVIAVGGAFGLSISSSQGIISALNVKLPGYKRLTHIQTDAAVNPGSSGGALFDKNGAVVGLISQIYSSTGTFSGLAFAISSSDLQRKLRKWKIAN